MAALITKDKIIDLAFIRNIVIKQIPDKLTEAVQEKHVRPLLGDDLFEALLATPESYSTLIEYVEDVIAYYVKLYILPEITVKVADSGLNRIRGENRHESEKGDYDLIKSSTLELIQIHIDVLTRYLNDNQDIYLLYYKWKNPNNRIINIGGIIFEENSAFLDNDEENY